MSFELRHDSEEEKQKSRLTRVDLEIFARCLTERNKQETEIAPSSTHDSLTDSPSLHTNQEVFTNHQLLLLTDDLALNSEEETVAEHELLLTKIKHKVQCQRRCQRTALVAALFTMLVSVPILTNAILLQDGLMLFVLSALLTLIASVQGVQLHRQMTTLVLQIPGSDPRSVGPIIEMLEYADMGGIPQRLLRHLLPQLQPADAVYFSERDRARIYRALADNNTELVLLLLGAVERIGDGRAIPTVTWLANGGGAARHDALVRDAAQHCLPILEARSVYDGASQTLLRASNRQPHETDHLLRPVAETEEDGTHLLRSEPTEISPEE